MGIVVQWLTSIWMGNADGQSMWQTDWSKMREEMPVKKHKEWGTEGNLSVE